MKKLMNSPADAVREMLEGMAALRTDVALLPEHDVLIRADADQVRNRQVALISGGGSGHEPAHGGYIGDGMLSAAVAGQVFSSPAPDAVLAAIRAVAGKPGALLIVKNYTGDRLNFGVAAEMARADGIPVEKVIVADDVALVGTEHYAGARGIAGTVFVHKIAGAAAAEGKSLSEVAAAARDAAASVATMGLALSAGILPASGKPTFVLGDAEIELGLGIHGEPGIERVGLRPADELARKLVERIVQAQRLCAGQQIAVLLNNLGSTTAMEMAIFARAALKEFVSRGLSVQRVYAGAFMTSLDAAGVSVSTLLLNAERLKRLDAPASAAGWPAGSAQPSGSLRPRVAKVVESLPALPRLTAEAIADNRFSRAVQAACFAIEQSEARLTALDQAVGDGDLGTNLTRGATAVLEDLSNLRAKPPGEALQSIGLTLQKVVGGSSGALYGLLFLRAGNSLGENTHGAAWAAAALDGCQAVSDVGQAKLGDRTMLDALWPFAATLAERLQNGRAVEDALENAVQRAEQGAEATAELTPKRGRASYLGQRALGHPDPGAVAVALWLRAVVDSIKN